MLAKLKVISLLVALTFCCGFLQSDRTLYIPWLTGFSQQSDTPQYSWYLASLQGNLSAKENLLGLYSQKGAKEKSADYWLGLLALQGSDEAVFQRALLAKDELTQRALFTEAARAGHPASQYELSLLSDSSSAKLLWLQKAAASEHRLAQIALYQWHLLHDDVKSALPWLKIAAGYDADSALMYAKHLWKEEQHKTAVSYFERAETAGHAQAKTYLSHIRQYWKKGPVQTKKTLARQTNLCHMNIQFVATTLESMVQATGFQRRFAQDKRLQTLPLCFNEPVWLEEVKCSDNWQGQKRLGCNPQPLIALSDQVEFTHAVVFAEQGKANVKNGIMFLDLADTYSVFVHELAHFAGFVDEYPLSSSMAQIHCFRSDAPNIMVTTEVEAPSAEKMDQWFSVSENVLLSKARTCNNHPAQAYKPTPQLTFMEYHDQGVIPSLYLSLWHKQLSTPSALTPVYVNFAQHLQSVGESQQAASWWQRFNDFLHQAQ